MVTFPGRFTATKLKGYFWDTDNKKLYSIKIGGVLKELARTKPNVFNQFTDGYRVSHNSRSRWLTMDYLNKLKRSDSVLDVVNR